MSEAWNHESYFSIAFEVIPLDQPIPYDLFINSSAIAQHEKFVRIFIQGEKLTLVDLVQFKEKYHRLYVPEKQRNIYLKDLCSRTGKSPEEKTTVLKDSAIHYLSTIFDKDKEFSTEVLSQTIVGCRDVVENMIGVLHNCNIDDLKTLIGKLSFHDFYTYDHSINVAMYSVLIYQYLFPNASKNDVLLAGLGGLLHDLGKIKIPTEIINNTEKLTDEQFALIKKHPEYGLTLLMNPDLHLPQEIDMQVVGRIVYEHHENFDGTGYPKKIASFQIHTLARVTAIADFFDAITTKRSYHEPLPTQEALSLMSRSIGKKIDPKIFQTFAQQVKEYEKNKHSNVELPSDFDPCQPCRVLPIIPVMLSPLDVKDTEQKPEDYGNIRLLTAADRLKKLQKKNKESPKLAVRYPASIVKRSKR